jgi:ABC-2 type transport system ATP-binding protein
MPKALSVDRLRRLYGDTVAVDGISFDVGQGEIVGLLGPGKRPSST